MAKRIGFTLGKYSPLHRGHQLVIETALSEMDRVYAVVYHSPETTSIPLSARANWIRELYPDVTVIEAPDGPREVGDSPRLVEMHNRYLKKLLGGIGITHFYSSEFYGAHVSKAFGAVNRLVDPKRKTFPVSGTLIRETPYAYRKYIPPLVYRDLVCNVVFLGAPCTGKTTLASRLAQEFRTQWMPEYGRDYWEQHQIDRRLTKRQLTQIAETHIDLENEKILESDKYLFTDTNAMTTLQFSLYYHGEAEDRLVELADKCAKRYDLFFLCEDDFPYVRTWDRSGEANRRLFQESIREDLRVRGIPFVSLIGHLDSRIERVRNNLAFSASSESNRSGPFFRRQSVGRIRRRPPANRLPADNKHASGFRRALLPP